VDIEQLIRQRAQERGVDPDLALSIAQAESSLRPGIKNPRSSARGLFQVTNDTWKQYGGDPKKRGDINEDIRVGLDIIADNTQALSQTLGRAPRPGEVYAAHFFGKAGARRILSADPNTPISEVVSKSVMKANPELLQGKTVGEAINTLGRKVGDETQAGTAQATAAQGAMANGARGRVPAAPRPVDGGYREDPANPPVISRAVQETEALGPGYQAALALSYLADTEESSDDENDPSIVEREAAAEAAQPQRSNAAQMLASMDFGYVPVVGQQQQEPVRLFGGGMVRSIASAVQRAAADLPGFAPETDPQARIRQITERLNRPSGGGLLRPVFSLSKEAQKDLFRERAQLHNRIAQERIANMGPVEVPTQGIMDMQVPVRLATGGLLERAASVKPFSPTARRQLEEARQKWEGYGSQVEAYNAALEKYKADVYNPYAEKVNAYNTALEQYKADVYNPYLAQIEAYNKQIEAWNAGPRTSDFTGKEPAAPKAFGMADPGEITPFNMATPNEPTTLSPEQMQALQERAARQRGQQAQALQVAADPSQFGLSMPSFFADGGEVTDPYAQMMQGAPRTRVSPGQFIKGGWDTAAGMLKGATQAAIGMPGDVESLIRMGVGSKREAVLPTTDRVKEFIDRYAPLNLPADEGTDGRTAAEYFGEFMSPAAATRPVVRGAQAFGQGVMEGAKQAEKALDKPVQDIMQRGGRAAEMLQSFSTTPSYAVRPPGGNVFPELLNEVVASPDLDRAIQRLPDARQDDIREFINTKARKYFQKDYASTKDPLYEAFKEGRVATLADTPAFRNYMLNAARDGNPEALEDLARAYDRGLEPVVVSRRIEGEGYTAQAERERDTLARLQRSLMEAPGPALDVERQLPSRYSMFRSQEGVEGYPLNRPLTEGELMAVERGDPIYRFTGSYSVPDFMRPETIVEALAEIPPERLKNMSYPEAVIAVNQPARLTANWNAAIGRVKEGKDVPKEVKAFGLSKPLLQTDNGAWHRIQDARAAEMEGAMMGHSVGGYSRVGSYGHGGLEALQSGRAKVFTLRDSKGNARVTVEALDTPEGMEITQIKGRSNAGPREAEVQDVLKLFEQLDEGGRLRGIRTESYLTKENAPADALQGTTEWQRLYDEYLLGKQ
jgi:hypothetical protein